MVDASDGSGEIRQQPVHESPMRMPLTAIRYVMRTCQPLLLADALMDDSFARDPYFREMKCCSLMVIPILRGGTAQAMLMLENDARRAAFNTARLEVVTLIADQLAATLESARMQERLESKVREQTRQLRETQSQLMKEATRAGMAQIAINVLHNVGNVLNSVNVSRHVLVDRVRDSRSARVADLAQLLDEDARVRANLFGDGGKGQLLPVYVRQLARALAEEREQLLAELDRLRESVERIKNVVSMQQSYARRVGASGQDADQTPSAESA